MDESIMVSTGFLGNVLNCNERLYGCVFDNSFQTDVCLKR